MLLDLNKIDHVIVTQGTRLSIKVIAKENYDWVGVVITPRYQFDQAVPPTTPLTVVYSSQKNPTLFQHENNWWVLSLPNLNWDINDYAVVMYGHKEDITDEIGRGVLTIRV